MKKLIFALAAVAVAAGAQAATVNWNQNTGTVLPGGGGPVANGLNVYLIQTSAHGQDAFVTAISQAASMDALTSTLDSWKAVATTTTGSGMGKFSVKEATSTAFTAGASEYAYYVVVDAANDRVFMSLSEKAAYDGVKPDGGQYDFAFTQSSAMASMNGPFDAAQGNKGAGWYTVVPEPTSGLLLLLGVAGLALRRRRA